jgi:hypothetical protein
MDPAVTEPFGEGVHQVTGQVRLGAGTLDRQGGQHRQRYRPRHERQCHDDRYDHPVVAEPQLHLTRRGTVVEPASTVHLLPATAKQGVIDHQGDPLPGPQQMSDDQLRHHQPDLPRTPPRRGEKPMRPAVVPHSGQTRSGEHAAHRPSDRLGHQPDH